MSSVPTTPCPCGKTAYLTWDAAEARSRQANRRSGKAGRRRVPISVYRCAEGAIHLTSQKRRDRADWAQRHQKGGRRGR